MIKKIKFTKTALIKMLYLVCNVEAEVAWYGIVAFKNDEVAIIKNILVPPQVVTSATVRGDDFKTLEWLSGLNTKTIKSLRFEGHSHANLGVEKSYKDKQTEIQLATLMDDGEYMIFTITNKKLEFNTTIYKKQDGVLQEYNIDFNLVNKDFKDMVNNNVVREGDIYELGKEFRGF